MEGSPQEAADRLRQMLSGKWTTAAISAAAELGVADELARGARNTDELALALACEAAPLGRLLRVLAGEGLVEADPHGVFSLTDLGAQLCDGELRDLARFVGADFMWEPWAHLPQAVREGGSAFEMSKGEPLFDYLDRHADQADLYHRAVDAFTRAEARALASAFDFSGARRVVDVGGGLGTLLVELKARWPVLDCVLYDRPKVIEAARERLAETHEGSEPFDMVGGDFLCDVPPEADLFVIKHVLHNWDDDNALNLLRRCRERLRPGGQILVIEGILLPGNRREGTRLMDLEMLVLCGGGRERSKVEFRKLLRESGLRLQSTRDLAGTTRLLVAEPRPGCERRDYGGVSP